MRIRIVEPTTNDYLYCILVTSDYNYEIIKSVIFKMLFQIDRSKDAVNKTIILKIKTALIIEQKSKPNSDSESLIKKLNNLLYN